MIAHKVCKHPQIGSNGLLICFVSAELELGLLDEAEEKFRRGIDKYTEGPRSLLGYGRAKTLLMMVQRDHQDGKSGAAYGHLTNAIECCEKIGDAKLNSSFHKLLGDLYSYGVELPLDLFASENNTEEATVLETKLRLISKGEDCYRAAFDLTTDQETKASLMTDIGSNILSRAQILEFHNSNGLWRKPTEVVSLLYKKASGAFKEATDIMPDLASAWCGFGCSMINADPLISQHAFVRALELDKKSPDAYANLSFLYTKLQCFGASTAVSDALTEVADTPAMWINRALILEDEQGTAAAKQQAADAYRAALQVSKTPEALRGLAMTLGRDMNSIESMYIIEQYLGLWGNGDLAAIYLHGAQQIGFAATIPSSYSESIALCGIIGVEQVAKASEEWMTDDRNNRLNMDKFKVLTQQSQRGKNLHVRRSSENRWSLQRQVVNNPSDASLWLELTKEMVVASAANEAAKTCKRASQLFEASLQSSSTNACQISEAYCLEQWIHLSQQKTADRTSVKKLQQALLMDPSNVKARQALRMIN